MAECPLWVESGSLSNRSDDQPKGQTLAKSIRSLSAFESLMSERALQHTAIAEMAIDRN